MRDIRTILDNPNFDRRKALGQQIELLTLKKQHLEDLIRLARTLQAAGGHTCLLYTSGDLAVAPGTDLVRGGKADLNRIEFFIFHSANPLKFNMTHDAIRSIVEGIRLDGGEVISRGAGILIQIIVKAFVGVLDEMCIRDRPYAEPP